MASYNLPDKIDYYSVERLKIPNKPQEIKKKSILVIRGREPPLQNILKRESSRTTIQWKGLEINEQPDDEDRMQRVSSLPSLRILLTKGSRGYVLQDILDKIDFQEGKYEIDEDIHNLPDRGIISIVRTLGSGTVRKKQVKDVKLTFNQETNLEILKYKIKEENDGYLKQHPELEILLSLVYRSIFKHKPKDAKTFIANYVHYLNIHRHKLVLDEVDIPFDRPAPTREKSEREEEREMLEQFVRSLLEECANSATLGAAYFNVTNVIKSIIGRVSSSSIISDSSVESTEDVVNDIMISLLTEVVIARTNSSELVVNDILNEVLAQIHPSIIEQTDHYLNLKQSVEQFIQKLLKSITEKAVREAKILSILHKSNAKLEDSDCNEEVFNSKLNKSILKGDYKSVSNVESRVKFISSL